MVSFYRSSPVVVFIVSSELESINYSTRRNTYPWLLLLYEGLRWRQLKSRRSMMLNNPYSDSTCAQSSRVPNWFLLILEFPTSKNPRKLSPRKIGFWCSFDFGSELGSHDPLGEGLQLIHTHTRAPHLEKPIKKVSQERLDFNISSTSTNKPTHTHTFFR